MSELDALIARVLKPGFTGTTVPDWVRRRLAGGLGSVILFATNVGSPTQVRALTDALRAENPDVFVAIDEEAGDITRLEHSTGSSFPGNLALGMVDEVAVTEAVARSVGAHLVRVTRLTKERPDTIVVDLGVPHTDPGGAAWVAGYGVSRVGIQACAELLAGRQLPA